MVMTEPSALVMDVVVEPSLLVTEVEDAPFSACSNASEFDPLAPELEPLAPLAPFVPSKSATW